MSEAAPSSKDDKTVLNLKAADLDFYKKFDQTHGKETRKTWYNDATEAYIQARPRYPDALVQDALKQARLVPVKEDGCILEIGCGPGTATVALARMGYRIHAMDPAPQNCAAVRRQCEEFGDKIRVSESTFEDYQHPKDAPKISAVLCPTSFHWVNPDVSCRKTAELLRPSKGCLMVWWAMPPMPSEEICDSLQEIYEGLQLPNLQQQVKSYSSKEFSQPALAKFQTQINESGYYQPNHVPLNLEPTKSLYTPERFVLLLSTLSPYIALQEETRTKLFEQLTVRLKELCEKNNQKELELTGFHAAQTFWVK